MEQNFLNTQGTLADKLMAALQGANVVGADTRCATNGTSSLFAFLEVAQPTDAFNQPSLSLGVRLWYQEGEPIDSLQLLYDAWNLSTGLPAAAAAQPLQLSPNPASEQLVVYAAGTSPSTSMLFDANGRCVPLTAQAKAGRLEWDVSGLAPGLYSVVVDRQGTRAAARFVKE